MAFGSLATKQLMPMLDGTVVDVAVTKSDLLDKLSETQPDVVLICLMDIL